MSSPYRFDELAEMDEHTLADLAAAHVERWTTTDELLAVNAEVMHSLYRAFVQAWGNEGTKLPDPLVIPRPGDSPVEKRAAGFGDLVRRMT